MVTGRGAHGVYTGRVPRLALLLGLVCLMARAAPAAPQDYRLDAAGSQVTFTYTLNGRPVTGRMPVRSARVSLDLRRLPDSSVRVTLDAARARAGVVFATAAMRGPKVLDTAAHPLIRFRTTAIRGSLRAATVTGRLTIRGTTRTVTLDAVLGRQTGTPPTERDRLVVLLTGAISRSAFGASGYAGLVGDRIDLRIRARITR
jgi:polyisoprenoid-binding protein YceI